jgi:hypothetical protein
MSLVWMSTLLSFKQQQAQNKSGCVASCPQTQTVLDAAALNHEYTATKPGGRSMCSPDSRVHATTARQGHPRRCCAAAAAAAVPRTWHSHSDFELAWQELRAVDGLRAVGVVGAIAVEVAVSSDLGVLQARVTTYNNVGRELTKI